MNILHIICDDTFTNTQWLLLSSTGAVIEKAENQSLMSIAQKMDLNALKIHLLIASAEIIVREVTIPKNISKSMINKIIPSLIEDELLSPIESVHFAIVKKFADKVTVALLDKDKLTAWQQQLAAMDIKPHAIMPLCVLLKSNTESCTIWFRENLAIAKVDDSFALMIEQTNLPEILKAHYAKEQYLPTSITFVNNQQESAIKADFSKYPEIQMLIERQSQEIWPALNLGMKKGNLLSRPETFSLEGELSKKLLIHTVLLLLFTFTLAFVFELITIAKLNKKQHFLNEEIAVLYKEVYPQATEVISPEQRIQSELKGLTGIKAGSFYDLLFSAGRSLLKNPNILLQSARFKDEKLSLEIESKAYTDIDKFIADLKKNPLTIKQDKTEQQGKVVKATISLSR
jgi:type II secretion system protein L